MDHLNIPEETAGGVEEEDQVVIEGQEQLKDLSSVEVVETIIP